MTRPLIAGQATNGVKTRRTYVNGYLIVATLPLFNENGTIREWLIAGHNRASGETVTAVMRSLTDTTWAHGRYDDLTERSDVGMYRLIAALWNRYHDDWDVS